MHYLGIDVSLATLETSDSEGSLHKTFHNNPTGLNQLVRWVRRKLPEGDVRVVLEPTNTYHERAVLRLTEAGIGHVLVSPLRARRYAGAIGLRAKTDRVDAQMLARMGEREELAASLPPEKRTQRLRALRRHLEWIEDELRGVHNRLGSVEHSPYTPAGVTRSLRRLIKDLERQAQKTESEIKEMLESDEQLSSMAGLLMSVPGVGMKTALLVLSELPAPDRCKDSRSWPAYCGVTPRTVQSGKVNYGVLSRAGRPGLRSRLYMATISAIRSNPAVAAYAARLAERGKTGKKAIMAAMHKLLRICFGVLKSRSPFDPELHLNKA